MKKEDKLTKAQEKINNEMDKITEMSNEYSYDTLELRLVTKEGVVKAKGVMNVVDFVGMTIFHDVTEEQAVGLFYSAIKEDLINKEKQESEGK